MSYRRFARGVRQMGGFAGGTSRLARPPARLEEPDIRPGGDCDLQYEQTLFSSGSNSLPVPPGAGEALAFIAHGSGTPITPPGSPWTEQFTTDGTGWSWGVWRAPADAVSSFDFTATAGGFATMITTPGAIGPWQDLDSRFPPVDPTTLFISNNSYEDPYHASVAVLLAAQPDNPADDFTLLAYGDDAGVGLEIGIWIFENPSTIHSGAWVTTTSDPDERYVVSALFPYECG